MEIENFEQSVPNIVYFKHHTGSPEWAVENERIQCAEITYIVSGQAVYTINRQKVAVQEGDLLCLSKGTERSAYSHDPASLECFTINFTLLYNGMEVGLPLPAFSQVGVHNDLISHFRKFNEDYLARSQGCIMRVRARLMLILQRFMEILVYEVDTHKFDPRIKQAIRIITENYAEQISITSVAKMVSLNPVYFGTLFKRETRVTFRDYLNSIRINQAEEMLRAGKWNVTEVATHCGFSDVFYFSRLFKKHKGIPPSSVV